MKIRFEPSDVELFSVASGDRNPLHCDGDYARRTPYGQPVVFGMLGAMTCLGTSRSGPDRRLSAIASSFRAPLYAGTEYAIEHAVDTVESFEARVIDGRRVLLDVKASFEPRIDHRDPHAIGTATAPLRTKARRLGIDELARDPGLHGEYSPSWSDVALLSKRTGIDNTGLDLADAGALLLLSYIVGMELPGERALFSTVRLALDPVRPGTGDGFRFEVEPVAFDHRINRITEKVRLSLGDVSFGDADVVAYARDDVPPVDVNLLRSRLPAEPKLTGSSAFVVGGSRGLGACVVHALSLSGCDSVFAYERSDDAAEAIVRTAPGPGRVEAVRGDASDADWCRAIVDDIVTHHGGLDLLVCNACPSFGPLDVHPATIDRLLRHVSKSLELTAVPISTCVEALADRRGTVAVVSSSYAATPPAEWPHYVASKRAIEGLVEVTSRQQRDIAFLILRPPKLLTDLTNTPLGRVGAIAPELVASVVARRLAEDRRPEAPLELVDTFA